MSDIFHKSDNTGKIKAKPTESGKEVKSIGALMLKMFKTVLPIAVGLLILWWIYYDYDFSQAKDILFSGINWIWMCLSLLFGVLSHVIRGWRWKLALRPIGENPKSSDCVDAVFVSYATNLAVPRLGEVLRCAALKEYDGVPLSKSFGTVVTERIIDVLFISLIAVVTFFAQMPVFVNFFSETGTKMPSMPIVVSSPWLYVSLLICLIAVVVSYYLLKSSSVINKIKETWRNLLLGMLSVRNVRNIALYLLYSFGIWACYFLHFYLTFGAFSFTSELGFMAGLVMFVGGTFAVVVPTPNGAGPWHFAIISMMVLYGVGDDDAAAFALIVHAIQTLLVVVLGVWGWLRLQLSR